MSEKVNPFRLWEPWAVAQMLGISERTLERYRSLGTGPEYLKIGNRIRYPEPALLRYVERNTISTDQSDEPTADDLSEAEFKALLAELRGSLRSGDD